MKVLLIVAVIIQGVVVTAVDPEDEKDEPCSGNFNRFSCKLLCLVYDSSFTNGIPEKRIRNVERLKHCICQNSENAKKPILWTDLLEKAGLLHVDNFCGAFTLSAQCLNHCKDNEKTKNSKLSAHFKGINEEYCACFHDEGIAKGFTKELTKSKEKGDSLLQMEDECIDLCKKENHEKDKHQRPFDFLGSLSSSDDSCHCLNKCDAIEEKPIFKASYYELILQE